jgi:hypothetical protein
VKLAYYVYVFRLTEAGNGLTLCFKAEADLSPPVSRTQK